MKHIKVTMILYVEDCAADYYKSNTGHFRDYFTEKFLWVTDGERINSVEVEEVEWEKESGTPNPLVTTN